MKKNNSNKLTLNNNKNFSEYKKVIDEFIVTNKIDKLRFEENYFDICNNYWIIDKYICNGGQLLAESTPNTLSAYDQAIKENYAITIPVQMLDDESIVCFSHKCLSRVAKTDIGYINTHTLKEIQNIPLNESNDHIPTLKEALDHIAGRTQVIIEIKNQGMVGKFEDSVLTILAQYIKDYNSYCDIAIMSINPYTLAYCYEKFPYITRILKSGKFEEKSFCSLPTSKLRKLKLFKITKADFISYSANALPYKKIKKYKPIGVIGYDVSSQAEYIKIAPYCDNIIFKGFKPTI